MYQAVVPVCSDPHRRVELDEGHAGPRRTSGGGSRVGDRDISWAAQLVRGTNPKLRPD